MAVTTNKAKTDAWCEGLDAYNNGLSYFDNPYVSIYSDVQLSLAWWAGWKTAYQMNNTVKGD